MPFLVVASITVPVSPSGATKRAPERIGTSSRTYNGSLRSTVRAEKRVWQFTTKLLTNTDAAAIEAAVTLAAQVTCSGDALGGSVTCEVEVGDAPYTAIGTGFKRALTLTLKEV